MPTSHGFSGYEEATRPDELSAGVPAKPQADAGAERKPNGTLAKGAQAVPKMGGLATKGTTQLSHRIDGAGLRAPYKRQARTLRRALCSSLATTVGGGVCDVATSLLVKFCAEATALAAQALDDGDPAEHRKQAESARMHLIYAREDAAKKAKTRPSGDGAHWFADLPARQAAFQRDLAARTASTEPDAPFAPGTTTTKETER